MEKRFYLLDMFRGIGALAVLFWHWPNFLRSGDGYLPDHSIDELPFYSATSFLYNQGWLGVHLFFALSGMVFYLVYSDRVTSGAERAYPFFVKRFSRIYPLAILTTLYFFLIQNTCMSIDPDYFKFQGNDTKNFLVSIFLLQAWGIGDLYSFNVNEWSISVEMFLYIVFFCVCRYSRLMTVLLLVLFSSFIMFHDHIGQFSFVNFRIVIGTIGFFAAGAGYYCYLKIKVSTSVRQWTWLLGLINLLLWVGIFIAYRRFEVNFYTYAVSVFVFPLMILWLSLIDLRNKYLVNTAKFFGDMSYPFYLIHYPLQVTFVAVTTYLGFSREIYFSPWMFMLFMVILLGLCMLSFHCFEKPLQRWLRAKLIRQPTLLIPENRIA